MKNYLCSFDVVFNKKCLFNICLDFMTPKNRPRVVYCYDAALSKTEQTNLPQNKQTKALAEKRRNFRKTKEIMTF